MVTERSVGEAGAAGGALAEWTIGGMLAGLAARGSHPAIIAFATERATTWESAAIADAARRLAAGLRERGVRRGSTVALCAPNSPVWIIAALAVLAAGAALAPLDDMADPEQLRTALRIANARAFLTTKHHLGECAEALRRAGADAVLVDDGGDVAAAASWRSLLREPAAHLPDAAAGDPALLGWTSGTTGAPKAFLLTHRNIGCIVAALRASAIVDGDDRALLPLPLHHAYPFVVGMLATLTIGCTIVLPGGTSGPLLARALRDGAVTTIVGVPRLYEALDATIAARIEGHGRAARLGWHGLLRLAIGVRHSGLPLGRWLFASVRRGVGPKLRLLASGGARLDRGIEERLVALGWEVLSGYGLAETASLFTCNRPDARRPGSAGRPLAGGEIRIARADAEGIGEIELRGPSITAGYLDDPEANRASFSADGWFRTGDLGFVDRDGYLFVTGRSKETLVLGGGKKVSPEDLERVYGQAPEIAEIAVLEAKGALVALVRPDAAKLRDRGATNIRDGIRVALGEEAQGLPSYQRLSGFALTNTALPRTRLGKYRRFLLPALYAQALAGGSRHASRPLTAADEALLRDPTAAAVWQLLRERFPDSPLDPDADLSLDLNLDSFGWMELSLLLHERAGVALSDADLAGMATVRDLLRRSLERRGATPAGGKPAASDIDHWLAPTGLPLRLLGSLAYALNRLVMRGLFRLSVAGVERLPVVGPFVIAPNHASYLDSLALAAALRHARLRHVYWAGDALRLFPHPITRIFCRAVHLFPVDPARPAAALEAANRVLGAGNVVVWFPEGWRSPDGKLQRFLPGIGELLRRSRAPAVPTLIGGAFAAWPRSRRLPRLTPLSVTFGPPAPAAELTADIAGDAAAERIAEALRRRLAALAEG